MHTKRLMIGLFAACAALSVAAAEFYVNADPNVGNDDYDGRAAVWDGEHGPIRTLANITNLVTATTSAKAVGDTVYVAEGDYNFGSNSSGKYRASLPAGTRLIGVGDRNKIRIFGSATDGSLTVPDDGAMRTLYAGDWTLVKNLTLCNGRSTSNGGCLYLAGTGYLVGCVISNNFTSGRGGALAGGTAIRCLFVKNAAGNNSSTAIAVNMNGGTAWNSVIVGAPGNSYHTYASALYNCTIIGGGKTPRYNSVGVGYNLLLCVEIDKGDGLPLWYSYMSCALVSSVLKDGSQADVGEAALAIDSRYVPVNGVNIGIDKGSSLDYESKFPTSALVADQKYLDFNGNPRIVGASIDVGACEFDPDERKLTITDAQTALVVTGAAMGETILGYGETNTFMLARNYSTLKLCTGVCVNGEFFSFTGENADKTYDYTYGYGDPMTSLVIEAVYAEHNDWYVDATNGDNANSGYTKYQAKKTLVGAVTNELVASGDVIHAAEGIYSQDEMGTSGSTSNRVRLAAGVGLVADGSVANTIIEGVPAKDLDKGNTAGVRCVSMGEGAYVKGFTLRNGSTALEGSATKCYDGKGGGVNGGTAIDCIITNCTAVRGGGANAATLIRCRLHDCHGENGTNPYGKAAEPSGAGTMDCSLYDSYVETDCQNPGAVVNSVLMAKMNKTTAITVYNSYVYDVRQATITLSNCLYSAAAGGCDVATSTKVTSVPKVDPAMLRPIRGQSDLMIDAGKNAYHFYPAAWMQELGSDVAGGQRVYNGKIDIGCGEYDWRGDFTEQLAAKGVSIEAASANVTTNELNGLVLSGGDTLKLTLVCKADGRASLRVVSSDAGGGNVAVKVGETEAPGFDGLYAFDVSAGETVVEISFSGTGTATLSDVTIPKMGMLLLFR